MTRSEDSATGNASTVLENDIGRVLAFPEFCPADKCADDRTGCDSDWFGGFLSLGECDEDIFNVGFCFVTILSFWVLPRSRRYVILLRKPGTL